MMIMKKIAVFILLLLSCCGVVSASTVVPENARRRAEAFFSSQPRTKAGALNIQLAWSLPDVRPDGDLVYAFNNLSEGGFVVVSGDDAVGPVLGYSLSGRFPSENMPEGLKWLLSSYGEVVRTAREKGWTAVGANAAFDPQDKVKLETALWGQTRPFNDDCPIVNGSRSVTGCVATAIGIIMNYHRWPERGTGEIPSYTFSDPYYGIYDLTIPGCTLGHSYDWAAMNADQPDYGAIAKLLHEIGVMTRMMYTPSSSGTSANYVKYLPEYFHYDKDIKYYQRRLVNDAEWERLLRAEIDARRPVLFCGESPQENHAMVIDGYCGDYFSINFGWMGSYSSYNGYSNPGNEGTWFLLTPREGYEKDVMKFRAGQYMYCNIKPDAGGPAPEFGPSVNSAHLTLPYDFAVNQPFTLLYSALSARPADCCLVLMDAAGNIREQISATVHLEGNDDPIFGWNSIKAECTVHQQPKAGDRIVPVMYVNGSRVPLEISRNAECRFGNGPVDEELRVGFVTMNETDYEDGFLVRALRDGYNWNARVDWREFLYFRCHLNLVWQLVRVSDNTVIWDSGEGVDDINAQEVRKSNMSLLREDVYYHFVRNLAKDDYILRLKNPLTGATMTINITI